MPLLRLLQAGTQVGLQWVVGQLLWAAGDHPLGCSTFEMLPGVAPSRGMLLVWVHLQVAMAAVPPPRCESLWQACELAVGAAPQLIHLVLAVARLWSCRLMLGPLIFCQHTATGHLCRGACAALTQSFTVCNIRVWEGGKGRLQAD